ncbi:MAG: SPOR domain-containing protein [Xanthobacteraceae bacterium]|nr:SPOR domain-containing protein [Xanthobacteraceae bacterium]
MADDNTRRSYRSHDPYRRDANQAEAPEQSFGGSDPLAELARLIGQSDPFADTARRPPQAAPPRTQRGYDDPDDWRRHVQRPSYDTPEEPAYDDRRYAADQHHAADHRYAEDQRYAEDRRYAEADPHASYAEHDPYRAALTQPQHDHYADPHADHWRDPSYTADYRDEPIYAGAPHHGDHIGTQQHGGGAGAREDEGYDDPPRRRRGSSLVTAVILIGCAMLGTAGAYGYRTYATSSGAGKQAPVIIADSAPSKVVPAEPKTARSQDRVGGQGNNEQLVSREEQPVTLQSPGASAVPRVVFPSPIQPGGAPTTTGTTPSRGSAPPPSASNAQSPGASTSDQPKRVRTVTIRPEGGDTSGQPGAEPSARGAPPPTARTAPAQPPRVSRDQPISLDPNAPPQANEPAARPQPQQRPLTPPAPRETAAPAPNARVASAPSSGGNTSGGFVVQVSSQKSEADAQSSYRALQSKYSQLKAHQPIIRRADLGNKGVFYRAMVGPFESGEEAVQFCNGLKQAGGQCIIHRN